MAVITSPTYDPVKTAEGLANEYVAGNKAINDARGVKAAATAAALTSLGSALTAFQSAMSALRTGTTSVIANSAVFSNTAIATATAGAGAVGGSYSMFVEKIASAGQVSYDVADSDAVSPGLGLGASMNIVLDDPDGTAFQVDLSKADANGDGTLTAKEVAAAINASSANDSRITASTMTVNGVSKLVLTSTKTGEDNMVKSIGISGAGSSALAGAVSGQTVLNQASDAVVWVGGKNGTRVQQASNTFSVIDDVKFTVTAAQPAGSTDSVTLTVAADKAGTTANVQTFVTAYNALLAVLDKVTAAGDHSVIEPTKPGDAPTGTTPDAALHGDAGVASLRQRLGAALRTATGGVSLVSFGISTDKKGNLALDTKRLEKAIAANPEGLDKLFGRAGLGVDAGALGAMNKLAAGWTASTGGLLASRKEQVTRIQSEVADREILIKNQFNEANKRYLDKFTKLQMLQEAMTRTSNMFDAMFSSDK